MSASFHRLCKACEQKERNQQKNADRPVAIIKGRAESRARELGVSLRFMWVNMHWDWLVEQLRLMASPQGSCRSCGHGFLNERDIQIDHIFPPRHSKDFAREHARNLQLLCQSCNAAKRNKPPDLWLDDEEDARISNERHRSMTEPLSRAEDVGVQLSFFD